MSTVFESKKTHQTKTHIPAEGKGSGKTQISECGRIIHTTTGDTDLLRRLAKRASAENDNDHYCAACLHRIRKAT